VPTYQYHCRDCGADLEVFQRMSDPSLSACPRCRGHLRKVFSPVGVVFKGSGFYSTDHRTKQASATTSPPPSSETASSGSTPVETKNEPAPPKSTADKPSAKPPVAQPTAKVPALAA